MEIRLILTACIVNCGLIPVQSHMQAVSQTNTEKVNYGGEIRGNVHAGAQTFDAMKEDLRTAQVRNFLKKKNPYQKSEHKVAIKRRETDDDVPSPQDVENQQEPEVHEPIINDPEKGEVWNQDPDSREPTTPTTPKSKITLLTHPPWDLTLPVVRPKCTYVQKSGFFKKTIKIELGEAYFSNKTCELQYCNTSEYIEVYTCYNLEDMLVPPTSTEDDVIRWRKLCHDFNCLK